MTIKKRKITSAYYDAAVKFCNEHLKPGQQPITELPPGRPRDPDLCPCGQVTGLRIGRWVYNRHLGDEDYKDLPDDVGHFVQEYDWEAGQLDDNDGKDLFLPVPARDWKD
jgi:hypothetical protein